MNASATLTTGSTQVRDLRRLLENLVEEVPGILSVAVVSSDGLLLLSSGPARDEPPGGAAGSAGPGEGSGSDEDRDTVADGDGVPSEPPTPARRENRRGGPRGSAADLATFVSRLGPLALGAAKLVDGGDIRQAVIAMDEGSLFVMSVRDGSLLGVHATQDCDKSVVAYHMALFVGRAGHVLTPELRTELRTSMELDQ